MACLFRLFLLLLIVCLISSAECGKGGKTAAKVGLVGISQVGSNSGALGRDADSTASHAMPTSNSSKASNTVMAKLKYDLLIKQGYDKAVRPVLNYTDQVLVDIDFTYMQTLNLNEKDQTLKSLLRYRVFWKDQFLTWNPDEYEGVTDIRLPSSILWVPDIVLYEEIGVADYNPRLPYAEIKYDGTVRYLEPRSLETTCSINIAHFPFDFQVCTMTFLSWTFDTSRLDIKSRRSVKDLQKDIPIYFVKTGEWVLDDINITKLSQDYAAVLKSSEDLGVEEFKSTQFFYMDPQKSVAEVADNRLTKMHWSEVQFKLMFRRNSSLYMQSMLFPALLLTTISLLGFYLPPDSGERIGLQITIMLTFMVFLLTVGDMFPASTGPFLGVYFVLCMALLGINIVMTVVVLHLHHMPCAAIIQGPDENMEYGVDLSPVPYWIRFFLVLSGVSEELKNFKLSEDDIKGKECSTPKNTGILSAAVVPIWNKCKTIFRTSSLSSIPSKSARVDVEVGHDIAGGGRKNEPVAVVNCHGDYLSMEREKLRHRIQKPAEEALPCSTDADENGEQHHCHTPLLSNNSHLRNQAYLSIQSDVTTLRNDVTAATDYLRFHNDELKDSKRCDTMEEKWKEVARRIDVLCMKLYIFLLVVFHVAILIAIFVDL